jgi:hypothetical protein
MDEMNYDEALAAEVTREEALREIARHDIGEDDPAAAFFADCGNRASYTGATVLNWLGY